MSYVRAHWRWILPATIGVLCLIVGTFTVIHSKTNTPDEPKRVYALPERTHAVEPTPPPSQPVYQPDTVHATPKATEIAPPDTTATADTDDDLEPLEECCDDEELLDPSTESKLSKEEIEEKVKIVNGFFDELNRDFKTNDADREALQDRMTDLEDNYFAYIDAIVELLSPEYRQRFDEIESHDELTQAERNAINDELHVIGKELGIDDMGEYMQSAAEEFAATFLALQASVDKLDENDMQLIKGMEEFSP